MVMRSPGFAVVRKIAPDHLVSRAGILSLQFRKDGWIKIDSAIVSTLNTAMPQTTPHQQRQTGEQTAVWQHQPMKNNRRTSTGVDLIAAHIQ